MGSSSCAASPRHRVCVAQHRQVTSSGIEVSQARGRESELYLHSSPPSHSLQARPAVLLFVPEARGGHRIVRMDTRKTRRRDELLLFLTAHMPDYVQVLKDKDGSHARFLAHPMPKLVYIADQVQPVEPLCQE
eukprot:133930-Hanusia_phi.AAC.1